jgi:hypothetical protein
MKLDQFNQTMKYLTRKPIDRETMTGAELDAFAERTAELKNDFGDRINKKDGDIVSDFDTQEKLEKYVSGQIDAKKESLNRRRVPSKKLSDTKVPLKNIDLTDLLKEIDQRLKNINELNQPIVEQQSIARAEPVEGIGSIEAPNEITLEAIRDLKQSLNKTKF